MVVAEVTRRSVMAFPHKNYPQQKEEQDNHEEYESIAGDSFFVSQRSEALNAASSEIVHEFGIRGGRPAEMVANPPE